MGAKQQTYATIREAFAIIANARLAAARGVADPDRYHARILADLRASLHDQALAIVEGDPAVTPAALAAALDASSRPCHDAPNPTSAIPDYTAEPWEPLDDASRHHATEWIARIREGLRKDA